MSNADQVSGASAPNSIESAEEPGGRVVRPRISKEERQALRAKLEGVVSFCEAQGYPNDWDARQARDDLRFLDECDALEAERDEAREIAERWRASRTS